MRKIGLLSDTHGHLPEQVFTHFNDVDEIWHAGDLGSLELAQRLEDFKPFRSVYGNIDGQELRIRYPEVLAFTCEELKVLMLHIGGYPPKYNPQSRQLIQQEKPGLFICGHSHILKVIPDAQHNLLHLNPGACGLQGWHQVKTLMRFSINGDKVENLEVIELGRRAEIQTP